MKKISSIGFAIGLVILISTTAKAQYFYTSFGYSADWNIPNNIEISVHNNYYGYEVAHVKRYLHHGYYKYNVLLYRNGRFVEVRYDRFGNIYKTVRYNNYPLAAHNCTYQCGYHTHYYQTTYPTHHTKVVYVNAGPNGKNHNNNHKNNYYTNVYVDNQNKGNHNGQNKYNGSGQQKQPAVVNQVQRTSTVIRQPEQNNNTAKVNTKTTRQVAPQTTGNQRTVDTSVTATANRSGRGSSR